MIMLVPSGSFCYFIKRELQENLAYHFFSDVNRISNYDPQIAYFEEF